MYKPVMLMSTHTRMNIYKKCVMVRHGKFSYYLFVKLQNVIGIST